MLQGLSILLLTQSVRVLANTNAYVPGNPAGYQNEIPIIEPECEEEKLQPIETPYNHENLKPSKPEPTETPCETDNLKPTKPEPTETPCETDNLKPSKPEPTETPCETDNLKPSKPEPTETPCETDNLKPSKPEPTETPCETDNLKPSKPEPTETPCETDNLKPTKPEPSQAYDTPYQAEGLKPTSQYLSPTTGGEYVYQPRPTNNVLPITPSVDDPYPVTAKPAYMAEKPVIIQSLTKAAAWNPYTTAPSLANPKVYGQSTDNYQQVSGALGTLASSFLLAAFLAVAL
jgi:hypothetical protein